ncbi:MAG TPA: hypothetical protein VFI95_08910 [Terriglobales bacterium]|jgi:hypothetical protein|nr:hypothetical protein [Terriglobales bacterium]
MNKLSSLILILGVLLLTSTTIQAQDYSNYRGFSLGTALAKVLKQTDQKLADVNVSHDGPSPIQEVTWWPLNIPGTIYHSDSVEQILFSFHDGKLYKMSVTYDHGSTEGLTSTDMVKSISTQYGPATSVAPAVDPASKENYDAKGKLVASWEDAQYSFNLVRSSFTDRFGLVIYSKQANAEAELAIAEALLLEKQNGPKRAAELEKKQVDDLEVARRKNQKTFRP